MTVYKYIGRTKTGAPAKGTIDALNKNAAIAKLRELGINPRQIEESNSILHKNISIGERVNNRDFVLYCRQFATLIRAGVSIVEATHILAQQTRSKLLKSALEQVEEDMRSGIPLSEATARHPKAFPVLFSNMIRSGEASGNMDEALDRLANTYERQYSLKKKVQSTLIYPIVLLILIIVVTTILMVFVVPTFMETYESMEAELPRITQLTISVSNWMQQFWWLILLLTVAIIAGFTMLYKNNERFNYLVKYALLRLPIFGVLIQKSTIARMTRNLSSLFSSGVPILDALSIVEKVIGNQVIGNVVLEARSSLEKGIPLSEPLERSWLFPPMVTSMIRIGETTGQLDFMLQKVADYYEDDVDRTVDTLKSFIEPIMIVLLAGIVGIIVVSIFLPMFSLYEQM